MAGEDDLLGGGGDEGSGDEGESESDEAGGLDSEILSGDVNPE